MNQEYDEQTKLALHRYFAEELGKEPFETTILSDLIRPIYESPRSVAYAMVRAYCQKCGCVKHIGKVAIAYYTDTDFNANARSLDGSSVIGISAIIALFNDLFNTTNPFVIKYQDNTGGLSPGDYRFPTRLPSVLNSKPSAIADMIENVIRDTVPDMRWQRIWALKMAELATVFIFAHELGHVIRGHTAALAARRPNGIEEVVPKSAKPFTRIRRLWELEADQSAIAFLWSFAIHTAKPRQRFLQSLRCKGKKYPVLGLVARMVYAISFVFFLIGQAQRQVNPQGAYPSALVRITYLLAMAQSAAEKVPEAPKEIVEMEIRSAHVQAEAAWNRLGLQFGINNFMDTIDDLPDVINGMDRRFNRSANILSPYAWARARNSETTR